jgi:hypothetical protein
MGRFTQRGVLLVLEDMVEVPERLLVPQDSMAKGRA